MLQCQRLALLQFAQKILLRPVEIRLLVHFRAALARRHRERADVDAIGLRALQQRDMAELPVQPVQAPPSDCAASDRWFGSGLDRASRRSGSALHRARHRQDGLYPATQLRPACIAPDRSGRSERGGRRRVRAACAAIALQCRSRRLRRSAAMRHFRPTLSHPPPPLSCQSLDNSGADCRLSLADARKPRQPRVLAFRRVETAQSLSIQAALRNCGGTRTLDYRSPIRHPALRSIKPGIAYRKTKSLGFRAHIANNSPAPAIGKPERRHKIVVPWSGIGKNRGEAKYETS